MWRLRWRYNRCRSCRQDCAGTWGGDAYEDNCGICDADSTNDDTVNPDGSVCVQDCAGVWNGDSYEDACGTCDANPDNDCAELDCAGVPNGNAVVDDCGVCDDNPNNDNTLLPDGRVCEQDCAGVWAGTATIDQCGVCDSDPNNDNQCEADCAVPLGDSYVDACGCAIISLPTIIRPASKTARGLVSDAFIDPNCGGCVGGTTGQAACIRDCEGNWGGCIDRPL